MDPESDLTLLYVNNTIYGEMPGGDTFRLEKWKTRPGKISVSLINGDYFVHSYQNVDFGGSRGWENQFQSTVPLKGSGPWFTFGRDHWWFLFGPVDSRARGARSFIATLRARLDRE